MRPYFNNDQEWWAHESTNLLEDRLHILVKKLQWNKKIVNQMIKDNKFSLNNKEIHKHRMDGYLFELDNIEMQYHQIRMRYNPKRIAIINQSIKQIQQL